MDKKSLAILGLGSRTTLFYIGELNRIFNQQNGGYSTCPFILWNINFNTINSLLPNTSAELNTITQSCIKEIEKLDIAHILIPNITLHESIDQIAIQKKILHPIHLTIEKIKEKGYDKIVLIGSEYTMSSTYIRSIFRENNIKIETPSKGDRLKIDQFRQRVYAYQETKIEVGQYHKIIAQYTQESLVVLACTELSILKPKDNKNLIDMAQVQIKEAINTL